MSLMLGSADPFSERTAWMFVDLGWVQGCGKEIYKPAEVVARPHGFRHLLDVATEKRGALASTARRCMVYDAAPDDPDRRNADGDFGHDLSKLQKGIQTEDLLTLRLGRLVGEEGRRRQKGVDTLLVADLLEAAYRGVIQVAHIISGDADFVGPIERVKALGIQAVLYQFEEARPLQGRLRAVADRTVTLSPRTTSMVFDGMPRYRINHGPSQTADEWVVDALHEAGYRALPHDAESQPDVVLCIEGSSSRDIGAVVSAVESDAPVFGILRRGSRTQVSIRGAGLGTGIQDGVTLDAVEIEPIFKSFLSAPRSFTIEQAMK